MNEPVSTWVGELDMAVGGNARPVIRPLAPTDRMARIWVRRDGAPQGFFEVPVIEGVIDSTTLAKELSEFLSTAGEDRIDCEDPVGPQSGTARRPGDGDRAVPVSIIVATKGRPDLAEQSLLSLQQLAYPSFEVVLVDGSPDGRTKEAFEGVVGSDTKFRYIGEPRPGLSLARNVGVSHATHEVVAFTDDDCRVDPHWLRFLVRPFEVDPGVACVTGMVPSGDLRTPAQQYFDRRVWWSSQLHPRVFSEVPESGDSPLYPFRVGIYGTGANFAMRRMAVAELGWFSELLGAGSPCCGGGEDQDMFVRVIRSGRRLAYEPSAVVWHEGRVTDDELKAQLQEYGRGILINGLKWLCDADMRPDVVRRLPRAVVYYVRLVAGKGMSGSGRGGSMVAAELGGVPLGLWSFVKGYRQWLNEESGFDRRPAFGRARRGGGRHQSRRPLGAEGAGHRPSGEAVQ